jgi:arylsulfate sulfotransferase
MHNVQDQAQVSDGQQQNAPKNRYIPIMKPWLVWTLAALMFIAACKKNKNETPGGDASRYITSKTIDVNPSGYAPLTAMLTLQTSINTRVRITVIGKHGTDSDVTREFEDISTGHSIPILGLYGGYENQVEVTLFDDAGGNLGTTIIPVPTEPLIPDMPQIVIDIPPATVHHDMTLVSYFGASSQGGLPHKPFIFDDFGDIRWYIDYTTSSVLNKLNIQDGLELLANRNLYFGDIASSTIYEIDMFGNILNSWPLIPLGYEFHHQVLEKPNGNFIITVKKTGIPTRDDHIIEINRATGELVNVWDFRQSLQYDRTTWTTDAVDWLHLNAVEYDPTDDCIIASGRTQGLVKVDASNNVKWIMAPHRGWGIAGNGVDLKTKLLQPLDAQGTPISDTGVLEGSTNHPDFEWNWYQHAPKKLNDGELLLFDNGDTRNFKTDSLYSRVVRYRIDETAMTVQQQWQYGKERGIGTYSFIVSDVDFNEESGNIIFSPGAITQDGPRHGKIIEIKANTADVLFEATITPEQTSAVTFHRTERMSLYR